MTLLSTLYWVILILALIGAIVPSPDPPGKSYWPRINSFSVLVLFVIIGLRAFKVPLG